MEESILISWSSRVRGHLVTFSEIDEIIGAVPFSMIKPFRVSALRLWRQRSPS
jgi:hypothetical protein